jgi:hypothetical protein
MVKRFWIAPVESLLTPPAPARPGFLFDAPLKFNFRNPEQGGSHFSPFAFLVSEFSLMSGCVGSSPIANF